MHHYFKKLEIMTKEKIERKLWECLHPEWILSSGLRVAVMSKAEWVIYNDIFVDGEYDTPINRVISLTPESPLVLDIGANVGYFSLCFADRWLSAHPGKLFHIIGVEGSPRNFEILKRRLDQPALNGQVIPHWGLAGQRRGEAHIATSDFHVTDSIMRGKTRFGVSVPFLDLTALIGEDTRIALLKCDIEGAEELFIENYPELLKRTDLAVFELHDNLCDVDRCTRLLAEAGLAFDRRLRDCRPEFRVDLFARNPLP